MCICVYVYMCIHRRFIRRTLMTMGPHMKHIANHELVAVQHALISLSTSVLRCVCVRVCVWAYAHDQTINPIWTKRDRETGCRKRKRKRERETERERERESESKSERE